MISLAQFLRYAAHKTAYIPSLEVTMRELQKTLKETEEITKKFRQLAPETDAAELEKGVQTVKDFNREMEKKFLKG